MLQENVSLKSFNTFGIDVKARYFKSFSSLEELEGIMRSIATRKEEIMILGGGSNVLFTKDFEGIILKNEIKGIEIISEDNKEVIIEVGAGEVWHEFVMNCITNNWAGIENLSLIPGNVGASPMQNIGAYGVEIKEVFESLKALHVPTLETHEFNKEKCEFGYRESVFKRKLKGQYIITHVRFKLKKKAKVNSSYGAIQFELEKKEINSPTIRDISNAVIAIRQSKLPDPKKIGNAGSFFKNPVISKSQVQKLKKTYPNMPSYPDRVDPSKIKLAAGWLIEQAGLKGLTIKDHGVHKNQALVLVNYGNATGNEIYDLSTKVIAEVNAKFGIELEREVNIV
ncbi:MAG: UDP-N-acetylmuramate dehydrogenase [Psychromonas sp.]|jgi:UDP-N-acetylmuramate dehydrogenase